VSGEKTGSLDAVLKCVITVYFQLNFKTKDRNMALKTGKEYLDSLKSLDLEANILGQKTGDLPDHRLVEPSQKAVAFTYDSAGNPETQELFCAESSLSNDTVNRFTHLHQSTQDLINKVNMQRYCGVMTACCFQRCVGLDAANAIYSTTFECDQKHGTDYHQRFKDYWKWVQQQGLVVDGAMTDPKGDRGKRPKDQADPDLYLRILNETIYSCGIACSAMGEQTPAGNYQVN